MVRSSRVCWLELVDALGNAGDRECPRARPCPDAEGLVIERTQRWLERAVIGLNLCPFAGPVFGQKRIRYLVCRAVSESELLDALAAELEFLRMADPGVIETTLVIHPDVLGDFFDFNQFLGEADALLRRVQLEGILQVASFHPQYCFAGAAADDVTNFSNRSPYPMLHLLRESSVAAAVSGPADADRIVNRNLETLRQLGKKGWDALGIPTAGES
jgi:uncharacterized protein